MSVIRLVEAGIVGFNDSIAMHVDPILKSGNGTTLLELWNNNTLINNVTIYQVLHMKGGLRDYNDAQMRQWTFDHPDEDFTPYDYLHALDKTFLCNPGDCEHYSSDGYSLLAFVTAAHNGATSFDNFDQMNYFPDDLKSSFNDTLFLMRGKCSKYPELAN